MILGQPCMHGKGTRILTNNLTTTSFSSVLIHFPLVTEQNKFFANTTPQRHPNFKQFQMELIGRNITATNFHVKRYSLDMFQFLLISFTFSSLSIINSLLLLLDLQA